MLHVLYSVPSQRQPGPAIETYFSATRSIYISLVSLSHATAPPYPYSDTFRQGSIESRPINVHPQSISERQSLQPPWANWGNNGNKERTQRGQPYGWCQWAPSNGGFTGSYQSLHTLGWHYSGWQANPLHAMGAPTDVQMWPIREMCLCLYEESQRMPVPSDSPHGSEEDQW